MRSLLHGAGTADSNMYLVPVDNVASADLKGTAHHDPINDCAFPKGYSVSAVDCASLGRSAGAETHNVLVIPSRCIV